MRYEKRTHFSKFRTIRRRNLIKQHVNFEFLEYEKAFEMLMKIFLALRAVLDDKDALVLDF